MTAYQPATLTVCALGDSPAGSLRRTVDALLSEPSIARRLVTDRGPAQFIEHPAIRYLGAHVEGRLVGVFPVVRKTSDEADIHVALVPAALPHARELGRLAVAQVFADRQVQRIVALVMQGLESARNYARKVGFRLEGFVPAATLRNGRPVGAHRLVLLRSDWEAAA